MAQTTTVVQSFSVSPIRAPGNLLVTVDNAILVGVWSTPIAATDDSLIGVAPGVNGTMSVQFTKDSVNWFFANGSPFSANFTGGVPPGVTFVRATTAGTSGVLTVSTPVPGSPSNSVAAGLVLGSNASAAANSAAMTLSASAGGTVNVVGSGNLYLSATVPVPSYTRFVFDDNCIPTIATGLSARTQLFRSANWASPQYAVVAASMTTADGKLGTCRFTGSTNFSVGSYVQFQYAAPDEWNGIWRVLSVTTTTNANDTITFRLTSTQTAATPAWTSPATALANVPGAAILGCLADVDISFEGGQWNFGGYDQGPYAITSNLADIMLYFRRVKDFKFSRAIFRGAHYGLMLANCYGGLVEDVYAEDCGNAVMLSGGGRDVELNRLKGNTFDNIWAIQQGDYSGYIDAGYTMADFSDIRVINPHSDGAYIHGKMIGASANINVKFRDIKISGMGGWVSGSTVFNMNDDPGMVPYFGAAAAPGTRIGSLLIDEIQLSRAMTGLIVSISENSAVSNIESLTVINNRVKFIGSGGNASALVYLSRTLATQNIGKLVITGNDVSADTTTNTFMAVLGGNVPSLKVQGNFGTNLAVVVSQPTSATAPITDGEITDQQCSGCGCIFKNGTASNIIRAHNWTHASPGSAAVQAFGGSLTMYASKMQQVPNSLFWQDASFSNGSLIWSDFFRNTTTASTATTATIYATGSLQDVALNASTTMSNPTRGPTGAGSELTYIFSASGAFTPSWGTDFKNPPALGAGAAGQKSMAVFVWSGSDWRYKGGSGWAT